MADRQLTGEITVRGRPITSRWRPGGRLKHRPDRQRQAGPPGQGDQPGQDGRRADQADRRSDRQSGRQTQQGDRQSGRQTQQGDRQPGQGDRRSGLARVASLRRMLPGLAGQAALGRASLRPARLRPAVRIAARKTASGCRRHPLEAASVTLMGLSGLAYPFPLWWAGFLIWLLGAAIATSSRLWELRDKWVGVAGPLVVVVVGTAIAVAVGGMHSTAGGYIHEVQAGSLYLIKVSSVAGAAYLAWRVGRGRRSPALPPWRRGQRP